MADVIHPCPCGRTYHLRRVKLPARDKDNIHCKCGLEVISWNGGVCYHIERIEEAQDLDTGVRYKAMQDDDGTWYVFDKSTGAKDPRGLSREMAEEHARFLNSPHPVQEMSNEQAEDTGPTP